MNNYKRLLLALVFVPVVFLVGLIIFKFLNNSNFAAQNSKVNEWTLSEIAKGCGSDAGYKWNGNNAILGTFYIGNEEKVYNRGRFGQLNVKSGKIIVYDKNGGSPNVSI